MIYIPELLAGPSHHRTFTLTLGKPAGDDLAENPAAGERPPAAEGKEAELGDEDLVTVSYMGDDLDLETVGDIIAIIEEKVTCTHRGCRQPVETNRNK